MKRKERTPLQRLRLARRPPTLTELADETGYNQSHLSRFEMGLVREPGAEFVSRYVRAMRKFGILTTRAEVLQAHAESVRRRAAKARPVGHEIMLDARQTRAR